MIEVYKYTHGLYQVSALPVEVEETTTRGHNYKLKKRDVPPLEDSNSSLCELSMPGIDYLCMLSMQRRLIYLNPALTCAGRT